MLDSLNAQAPFEIEDQEGLDPLYYYQILKKRKFYGLIPFICIFAIGFAIVMLWPPTYQSEGKILVESQQIPGRPCATHRHRNGFRADCDDPAAGDDPREPPENCRQIPDVC